MRRKLSGIWPIIGAIAAIYIAVLLFGIVRRNYELKKQITDLEHQVAVLAEEKDELTYQIQYYKTDSFKEKQARAKLGLSMPGEGVIILPRAAEQQAVKPEAQKSEKSKANYLQWWEFLFG